MIAAVTESKLVQNNHDEKKGMELSQSDPLSVYESSFAEMPVTQETLNGYGGQSHLE